MVNLKPRFVEPKAVWVRAYFVRNNNEVS